MGYAAAESARPVINADGLRGMLMATAALGLAGNILFACVSSGGDSDSDSGWSISGSSDSSSSDSSSSDSGGDSGGGGDGGGE